MNHQIDDVQIKELLQSSGFEQGSSSINLGETLTPAFRGTQAVMDLFSQ